MRILLLGSGGRESALAWKISIDRETEKLFIAPGNGGTDKYGTNVDLSPLDFDGIRKFVAENDIDMIVVGNEDPLVAGIADYFQKDKVLIVGPSKAAAALEGSKDFAKGFMKRHGIPTARYKSVTAATIDEGFDFLESLSAPYVLKADGLAAGKGVIILQSLDEAKKELRTMLEGKFGKSSQTVVIEEFLSGIECSVFILADGKGDYLALPVAKDYKRIGEKDTGPNTGGMGALSPVCFADARFMEKVRNQIIRPTLCGLEEENIPYRGFLFFGLINVNGEPKVIEYNVRLGDPETEAIIPLVSTDLVPLLKAAAEDCLGTKEIEFLPRAAATVMLVSKGYPGKYETGKPVTIKEDEAVSNCFYFHAGTRKEADGTVVTSGGRVMAVTAYGTTERSALQNAYKAATLVEFEGKTMRRDIGTDLLCISEKYNSED